MQERSSDRRSQTYSKKLWKSTWKLLVRQKLYCRGCQDESWESSFFSPCFPPPFFSNSPADRSPHLLAQIHYSRSLPFLRPPTNCINVHLRHPHSRRHSITRSTSRSSSHPNTLHNNHPAKTDFSSSSTSRHSS